MILLLGKLSIFPQKLAMTLPRALTRACDLALLTIDKAIAICSDLESLFFFPWVPTQVIHISCAK